MKYNGAVLDSNGKIIKLRPFPNQSDEAIPLGEGRQLVKLTEVQMETAKEGSLLFT